MARFLETTERIQKENQKKKKTTTPKQTTPKQTAQPKQGSQSSSASVNNTVQRLQTKYSGGSTRGTSGRSSSSSGKSKAPQTSKAPAVDTTSAASQQSRTNRAKITQSYGQQEKSRRQQTVDRLQAKYGENKGAPTVRSKAMNRTDTKIPVQARMQEKYGTGAVRGGRHTYMDDVAKTAQSTLRQIGAEEGRMFWEAAKNLTRKDSYLYATPEKIREANAKADRKDEEYKAKIEQESRIMEGLKQNQGYFGQRGLEAVSSGIGMATDAAWGPASLMHMYLRSYAGARGKVKDKAAKLRERMEATGNYTPEELDEMFKNVEVMDMANAMFEGGIEAASERMFGGNSITKKIYGGGMLDKAVSKLGARMSSKAATGIFTRVAKDTAEEIAEEEVGNPLQALASNLIYGNRFQGYVEDSTRRSLQAQSDDIRSMIRTPEDAQAITARLGSSSFREETVDEYKQAGMSDDEAQALADKSIRYLTAAAEGDTATMERLREEMVRTLSGKEDMKEHWGLQDAIDVAVSTAMMTVPMGGPTAVISSHIGQSYKETNGMGAVANLARVVKNLDVDKSTRAQAILDRIESGQDISGTQVHELIQWAGEAGREVYKREDVKERMADAAMKQEDLKVPPVVRTATGEIVFGVETAKRYAAAVQETMGQISAKFSGMSTDAMERAAEIVAGFQTGTINAEQMNELSIDNPENREIFHDATGIDLGQFTVKDKKGNINAAATNIAMQDELFARAASNYVESARIEQEAWNSDARADAARRIEERVGTVNNLAVLDALRAVDPRDKSAFMLMGAAAESTYEYAWNSQDDWETAQRRLRKLYPSLKKNISELQGVFQAAKDQRKESETPFVNAEVKTSEKVADIKKSGQKAEVRGKFTNLVPYNDRTQKGRDLNDEEQIVLESLAKYFNVNIYMVDKSDANLRAGLPDANAPSPNAQVDFKNDGTIYINSAVGVDKAVHEITHICARLAGKSYLDMAHYILDKAYKHDSELTKSIVDSYKQAYAGQGLTDAQIEEEVVADIVSVFANDPIFLREISQEQPNLIQRIFNAICDILRSLRNIMATGRIQDPDVQESFLAEIGAYEQARTMMLRVMAEAHQARAEQALDEYEQNMYESAQSEAETDVRNSITPEMNAEYMQAVESDDMETAQRLVEEAAKAAGYTLSVYHGTGEYFNVFNRGYEGIHLGNEEQASQVADNRFNNRSKYSKYRWEYVKENIPNMDAEARETLVKDVYWMQDEFSDGESVPPFEGDLSNDKEIIDYAEGIMNRWAKAEGYDYIDDFSIRMRTFDRKTDRNVMHLYARINKPLIINGDITQWDPASIARMLQAKSEGDESIVLRRREPTDISGSKFKIGKRNKYAKDLEAIAKGKIYGDEAWDLLSEVLGSKGYDGIQYKNEYEGDKQSYSYIALKQSDVKSADPVTYDESGNVIPLDERFNTQSPDIRFSITPQQDADYMAAVESGDTETAQRMVDEAAAQAMPDTKLKGHWYHGTENDFNIFKFHEGGKNGTAEGFGIYLAQNPEISKAYGSRTIDGYVNMERPAFADKKTIKKAELRKLIKATVEREATEIAEEDYDGDVKAAMLDTWISNYTNTYDKSMSAAIAEVADSILSMNSSDMDVIQEVMNGLAIRTYDRATEFYDVLTETTGFDGFVTQWDNVSLGEKNTIALAFRSEQIKDSSPVTYDDNGEVIPLSERFNAQNPDIRYSMATDKEDFIKGANLSKELREWAKEVGLDKLSKQPIKGPVIVSVRDLRTAWYEKNGRSEEAEALNAALDKIGESLTQFVGKYQYIDLGDAVNAAVSYRTDSEGHPTSVILSCQVKNAEYEVNFDFTTICAKRLAMQKVLERFIKTEGERQGTTLYDELKLDEEGLYKLRLILETAGFEVSCKGCFVEQNRYSQQNQARTIANDWNKAIDEWEKENNTKITENFDLVNMDIDALDYDEIQEAFNNYTDLMSGRETNVETKNRTLIEAHPFFRKRMNPSDYASMAGQRALMAIGVKQFRTKDGTTKKGTTLYGLLKRGQSDSKQSVPFTAYNGEISLLPDNMKGKSLYDYLLSIGGARAQSASDFQIEFVYDYMQMVADLSARGLPMHMYTKVIELAELFGMTGIKINLSAMCDVAEGVGGEYAGLKLVDGKYEYNISDQSIDYEKAVDLQKKPGYSKNIGIIMVTLSSQHMLKSLDDPDVRYIIGYHSSAMPVVVANMSNMGGATDYTKINKTNKLNEKGKALFDKAMSEAKGETELDRYKDALRIFDEKIQEETAKKKKKPRRGNEYGSYMSAYGGNTADFNTYESLLETNDARKTADKYLEYCMKKGLIPIYFPFAFHENYYKCEIYDFNMYDNVTGEYAPMGSVQNIYPGLDIAAGETDTTAFTERVSQMMDERNKINKALDSQYDAVFDEAKRELRYSISGDDYMDFDASGIKHNELIHRADVLMTEKQQRDAAYMSAVNSGDMGEAQRLVDEAAQAAGMRVAHRYHGTMNAGFTVFDKAYAKVGGNSGAGFYFSTEEDDSINHYQDVEGADNYFKWSQLADKLMDEGYYEDVEIIDYDHAVEIAKELLNENPGTYDVYLNYKNPYVRNYKDSTNIYDSLMDDFDESVIDRDDYDNEDDYEEALWDARTEHIQEEIYRAVYGAYSDLEDFYEVLDAPYVSDVSDALTDQALSNESLTWDDILYALRNDFVELIRDDWDESGYGETEFARAIIENFGFDAIEDKEVSSKFGQLSREMMTDTEHIIVFKPEQIKLSDPVTYDQDGNVIPLSERFDPNNNDIRYSMPTQDSDGNILSDGQMEFFKNSQARDEQGRLMMLYHGTSSAGFTVFETFGIDGAGVIWLTTSRRDADAYGGNREHKLFDPNEPRQRGTAFGGSFMLDHPMFDYMRFDTEEDRQTFIDEHPDIDKVRYDDELFDMLEADEIDEDEYDRLNRMVEQIEKDYAEYERDHFGDYTWGEMLDNPERFTKRDLYRAITTLDKEASIDDINEVSKEDLLDLMYREEEGRSESESIRDMTVRTRIPEGENGEYTNPTNNRTYPLYANIENPMIVDMQGKHMMDGGYAYVDEMRGSTEYDGLIIKNAAVGRYADPQTVVLVKRSDQIKDIRNTEPTSNPDIRYSKVDSDFLTAFLSEQAEKADDVPAEDPLINEGKLRISKGKLNFINRVTQKWNPTWKTEGRVLKPESIKKDVRELVLSMLQDAKLTPVEKAEIVEDTVKVCMQAYAVMTSKNDEVAGQVGTLLYDHCMELLENTRYLVDMDSTKFGNYSDLADYLRTTAIVVPRQYWKDINYGDLRRRMRGKILFKSTGTDIDIAYQKMQEQWPEAFPVLEKDDIQSIAEQFEIAAAMVEPIFKHRSSEECADMAGFMCDKLFDIIYNGIPLQSYADKMDAKIKALKARQKEAIAEINEQNRQKLQEQKRKLKAETKTKLAEQKERLDAEHEDEINTLNAVRSRELKTQRLKADITERDLKKRAEFDRKYLQSKHRQELREERAKRIGEKAARRERLEHNKYFKRIQKNHKWLRDRLFSNTQDLHIPEQYKHELAELLAAFDLQTVGSKKREESTGVKAQNTLKLMEIREKLRQIEVRTDEFHLNDAISDIIDSLLGQNKDFGMFRSIEGLTIDECDNEELKKISDLLAALKHEFINYEYVRAAGKKMKTAEIGTAQVDACAERVKVFGTGKDYYGARGAIDRIINLDEVTPAYLFKRIDPDGKGLGLMWKELRHGFDKYVRNQQKLNDWMQEIIGPYHSKGILWNKYGSGELEKWRSENYTKTFRLESGETVELTPAQMMSLYCLSKRAQAMSHILGAGIVVAPASFQARMMSDLRKKTDTSLPKALTEADILHITTQLTPEQIDVAEKLQKLMANEMAAWGNEASMSVIGIKLFNEPNYFPIRSDKKALDKNLDDIDFVEAIRNFGFTKAVQPGARNAIMVEDIFDVVTQHCNNMNLYNAYSECINDFMKVYNYRAYKDDGVHYTTVEQAVANAWSSKAATFIKTFMKDLNGNVSGRASGIESAFNTALGNAKKASVFANARVAAQQPTAITRAFAVIDPKYMKGIKPEKGAMIEMFEHCPIALWKSWGYYDINMGKSIEDIMMNNGRWLEDMATELYGKLDNVTWTAIWQMVKAEIRDTHSNVKEGSEEFWEMCNDRMSEVVDLTQVVDSPMHRSHAMRDKGYLQKMVTSFMAEPTLTFNMIKEGYVRAYELLKTGKKAEAAKAWGRTTAVALAQAAAVAAFAALVDALRHKKPDKDDEDETFLHLWKVNILNNFKDEMKVWNKIYYVKDIASLADGWGINNLGMQGWQYLATGWMQLNGNPYARSSKEWYENMLYGIGMLSGVPVKTMMTGMSNALKWFGVTIPGLETIKEGLGAVPDNLKEQKGEIAKTGIIGEIMGALHVADDEETDSRETSKEKLAGSAESDTVKGGKKAVKKIAKNAEKSAPKTEKQMVDEIVEKTAGYTGEDRNKRIWDIVSDGYKEHIASGDYDYINHMRLAVEKTGGDLEAFDQKIYDASKTEFKKSIIYDPTPEQIQAQAQVKWYLTQHGMTEEEMSDIAYHSDVARELKVAMRLNDEDAIAEELEPLVRAGLSYDDVEKLYKNRNRIDLKKYNGKYKDRLKSTGTYNWPIEGTITSRFGYRKSPGGVGSTNHMGIDIAGAMGDPIRAADGGTVCYVGWYYGGGNTVMIEHDDGTVTQYMHMSAFDCKEGDTVAQGQQIGQVGSTGNSTGPHCHFGVKKNGKYVDPLEYLG